MSGGVVHNWEPPQSLLWGFPPFEHRASRGSYFRVVGVVDVDFFVVKNLDIIFFCKFVSAQEVVLESGSHVNFFCFAADVKWQVFHLCRHAQRSLRVLKYFA